MEQRHQSIKVSNSLMPKVSKIYYPYNPYPSVTGKFGIPLSPADLFTTPTGSSRMVAAAVNPQTAAGKPKAILPAENLWKPVLAPPPPLKKLKPVLPIARKLAAVPTAESAQSTDPSDFFAEFFPSKPLSATKKSQQAPIPIISVPSTTDDGKNPLKSGFSFDRGCGKKSSSPREMMTVDKKLCHCRQHKRSKKVGKLFNQLSEEFRSAVLNEKQITELAVELQENRKNHVAMGIKILEKIERYSQSPKQLEAILRKQPRRFANEILTTEHKDFMAELNDLQRRYLLEMTDQRKKKKGSQQHCRN